MISVRGSPVFWSIRGIGLAGVVALIWLGSSYATRFFLDQTDQAAESTLRLTVAALHGALNRYRPLPELIADFRDVRHFLERPSDDGQASDLNSQLRKISDAVQASDIYIMKPDGLTVAASNFDRETTFIGRNFSFRPYFKDAISGRQGRYFALGTTSLKRGYYFTAPVRRDDSLLGVVALKMDVDEIEAAWKGAKHEILVVDGDGIVFMSGRPEWRFGAIRPLSPAVLNRLSATRKYPTNRLFNLPFFPANPPDAVYRRASILHQGGTTDYLIKTADMPEAGWTVYVLAGTASARAQAYTSLAVGILLLLTMLLASAFVIQRRQTLVDRLAAQQAARDELEQKVEERTADLNQANAKLVGEIAERKSAEQGLRKAQAELIQAGKLAALGQMSAALSHEFNQPLGAAKTYADNAAAYIDRGRTAEARENITRISSLIDRMAAIGRHLRNFARKPDEKLAAVSVSAIINDALAIVAARIKSRSVEVATDLPEEPLYVLGGQNRLQQVLVNLLSNALDAMEEAKERRIEIAAWRATGDRISISVRDSGVGIGGEAAGRIFDPFFTTKGVGKGLGLGLSISYNIIRDFGGTLSVENHGDGGAVFTISLRQVAEAQGAIAE